MTEPKDRVSSVETFHGYVAEDKDKDSVIIKVYIPELQPMQTGAIDAKNSSANIAVMDASGKSITFNTTTSNNISATYEGDGNHKYPPDVMKGEQVTVRRVSSDKFTWSCDGRDKYLRKNETLRIEIANRQGEDDLDDTNTYLIELDTKRGKHFRISLANSDGEFTSYKLEVDMDNATAYFGDILGNTVCIDSNKPQVVLTNSDDCMINLQGKNGQIIIPETLLISAGKNMILNSPLLSIANTSGDGIFEIASNFVNFTVTNSTVFNSPCFGVTGSSKFIGQMVASAIRAASYNSGDPGSQYKASSISSGLDGSWSGTANGNSPDNGTGDGERHTAAYEDMVKTINTVIECFNQVQGVIGVPSSQGQLAGEVAASIMPLNMGE